MISPSKFLKAMKRAQTTVAALAAQTGVSAPTIYNLLDGTFTNPTVKTAYALARALGVTIEALLSKEVTQ